MEASIIKITSHNSHMPVDRHQPRGFFLHQLQHGKQWRTPKSTINLTAPSRFSNVGKPSPSPGIDGKKNTAQNTPHGKTPRLRILFFVWSPRTSNLSFAKLGHLRNFVARRFCTGKASTFSEFPHHETMNCECTGDRVHPNTRPWDSDLERSGLFITQLEEQKTKSNQN